MPHAPASPASSPGPDRWRLRHRATRVTAAVTAALVGLTLAAAAAPSPASASPAKRAAALPTTTRVTLVTGDVALVTTGPGGRRTVALEPNADGTMPQAAITETGTTCTSCRVPRSRCSPRKRLDLDLFDVAGLMRPAVRRRRRRGALPVIVDYGTGAAAARESRAAAPTRGPPHRDGARARRRGFRRRQASAPRPSGTTSPPAATPPAPRPASPTAPRASTWTVGSRWTWSTRCRRSTPPRPGPRATPAAAPPWPCSTPATTPPTPTSRAGSSRSENFTDGPDRHRRQRPRHARRLDGRRQRRRVRRPAQGRGARRRPAGRQGARPTRGYGEDSWVLAGMAGPSTRAPTSSA